ncbi:DNA polymerase III subunit beta [Aerococcaceae bacterium NML201209]|nr:DNA polymerase III subunit beta [Aerococcaceae bacterium NML201209]
MKFTIQRQAFINQLGNVSRAISSKATIPVLTGLKLQTSAEGLTLIGSDANISIESFLPISDDALQLNIEAQGSIVLPSRLFNEVIKKLPTDQVTIEVDNQHLATITSGKAVFQLNGVSGDQYPKLPEVDTSQTLKLPTLLFKQLIHQTIFSSSNQETRPILTGLNLTIKSDYLSAIATDSHRLSKREIPVEADFSLAESITIPKKTVSELARIVEDEADLSMAVTPQQVIFMMKNLTIYSRLLEGTYPDTSRLIPTTHNTELVVKTNSFIQAIERASLMAHEGKNNVVQLDIADNRVELSVRGIEIGHLAEEINYEALSGENILISFNPDYMREALRSFGDTQVKIHFQSAVRPLLLSAETESELPHNSLVQLLTPIRSHYG